MRNVGAQTQEKLGPGGPPPKGLRREGRGPESGGPKISLFFSLWGSSRGILVVFLKRWDPQNVHVWSSRAVMKFWAVRERGSEASGSGGGGVLRRGGRVQVESGGGNEKNQKI